MDSKFIFTQSKYTWAIGNFPTTFSDIKYAGQAGDIFLNIQSEANRLPSYAPGSAGFALLLHEIGHTLGLKHTHDDGGTGRPTFAKLGIQSLDRDWFSIMSYNDDYAWNQLDWNPTTPMALDCLGLMYIYGPNPYTNAGQTTHTIKRTNFYETLWDAGGTDTLDFSTSQEGWVTSLQLFTDPVLNIKVGITIPAADNNRSSPQSLYWLLGTYENIIGSNYGDYLDGNDVNNSIAGNGGGDTIRGGGGDDFIDGGTGLDTCVYDKAAANYTITPSGNQTSVKDKSGTEGTDTLQNVERLHFADKTIALDIEGNAGQVYRVYQAAFNRTPDKSGLQYWINAMDNGQSLKQVAAGFINSSEFKAAYGSAPTAAQFVSKLYNNVLHRAPEQSGYNYWLNQVGSGGRLQNRCPDLLFGIPGKQDRGHWRHPERDRSRLAPTPARPRSH